MDVQPPMINPEAVSEWWRLAITSFNQQVGRLCSENSDELKSLVESMVEQMEAKFDDAANILGEDDAKYALDNARNTLMNDPGFLLMGKWISEMLPVFLSHMSDGDFTETPGTKIQVFAVRSDSDGFVRGCDIKRSPVSDDEITDIASNGLAGIEDFLKSVASTDES